MSISMFTKLLTTERGSVGSGYNLEGQLDNKSMNYEYDVTHMTVRKIDFMDKSVYHTIYVTRDGQVKASGYNGQGQLGVGDTTDRYSLVDVPIKDVKDVKCGGFFTVFLLKDGTVRVCGSNDCGQLGLGDKTNRTSLTKLNLTGVRAISCGSFHTFFLMNNGSVYACGRNSWGQLGLGDNVDRTTPTKLNISNISNIVCGAEFTYFILSDGSIYSCGYNGYGQLGTGTDVSLNTPQRIQIDNVKKIECSSHHTIFLKNDKTVYGCGHNGYGQLGLGHLDHQYSIVKLPIEDVSNVMCSGYTSMFLIHSKLIKGCGHNRYGQLGLGDNINRKEIIVLRYTDIWDDDLSDEIITLPPFDRNKRIYVMEGYFVTIGINYIFMMDRDMTFKVYNKEDMTLYDEVYFYIERGQIKFTRDKNLVFNAEGYKSKDIDALHITGNKNVLADSSYEFAINHLIFKYDTINKKVSNVYTNDSICTSIHNNLIIFDNKCITYNGLNFNSNTVDSRLRGHTKVEDIDFFGYKVAIFGKKDLFLTNENYGNIKRIDFKDEVTAVHCCNNILYVGTKYGFLYMFASLEELERLDIYRKFDKEISMIKIKDNKNKLTRKLLIDMHGSVLILGFTDGNYKKLPLYEFPDISLDCTDMNFIDGKVHYHTYIRLNTHSPFYENMRFLVHDKYNDEEISVSELTNDYALRRIISFDDTSVGIYTHLRLNYLFGNNSLGSIYKTVCNIKTNMMYYHYDKLFLNLSNYSSFDCQVVLEDMTSGQPREVQSIILNNQSDNTFFSFNSTPNMKVFNLKLRQNGNDYYLKEEVSVSDITLSNSIKYFNNEGDIMNDFNFLINKIYENKSLSDISTEEVVNLLNKLSLKKLGKTERLEDLKLDDYVKNDIYGNTTPFLLNTNNHYLMNYQPEEILKDKRYRASIYINGRKVLFDNMYNLVNSGDGRFNSYFTEGNIEKLTRNYVEGVIYQESLALGEKELKTIHITNWEDVNKLLRGEYYVYIHDISQYIDERHMSLYLKFRHGAYSNRITMNTYDLILDEVTNSYYKFRLHIKDQVLCQIGNEIHITLNDLDKGTNIIVKDTAKNQNKKYKNYFVPLIALNENGSITNFYIDKSENVDVCIDGYTLIPYVDYKVVNFPLHLQIPSLVVFKNPIKSAKRIEISTMKEELIPPIVKDKTNDNFIISNLDENLNSTFVPLLYNTYDKFVDNLKIPNLDENGKNSEVYSNIFRDRKNEYIKFYLENNSLVRFLITLLRLKIKDSNLIKPDNIGSINRNNFNPIKTSPDFYFDNSNEGLLYFLFEKFDKSILKDENIRIDCDNSSDIEMKSDIILDSNMTFSLPYITDDILLDCNRDYNKTDYSNNLL